MAATLHRGKLYPLFTLTLDNWNEPVSSSPGGVEVPMAGGVAIAMFIALVGWGGRYFGWDDPEGRIQLALVTAFILGIIGGYKAKG
jgi:hypothetical protein